MRSHVAAHFNVAPTRGGFPIQTGGNVAEKPIANPTIVAIFSDCEDRTLLVSIFAHSEWKLKFTRVLPETQNTLRRSTAGVVISDSHLSDGCCWKDLLTGMKDLRDPPPLIVADRLADERLWAEVLNLGAYDLLAKPFDAKEVLHAVASACRHSENERQIFPHRRLATSALQDNVPATQMRTAGAQ